MAITATGVGVSTDGTLTNTGISINGGVTNTGQIVVGASTTNTPVDANGKVSMSASAGLVSKGSIIRSSILSLSGSAGLSSKGDSVPPPVRLTASGTMIANAAVLRTGSTSLSGTATLSSKGIAELQGSFKVKQTVSMLTKGLLIKSGLVNISSSAQMIGHIYIRGGNSISIVKSRTKAVGYTVREHKNKIDSEPELISIPRTRTPKQY